MREMHFEILGPDEATVAELAGAVVDQVGLTPATITSYAAHYTDADGVTTAGLAPAVAGIGPATFFTFGPAAEVLAERLSEAFTRRGWQVRSMDPSAA